MRRSKNQVGLHGAARAALALPIVAWSLVAGALATTEGELDFETAVPPPLQTVHISVQEPLGLDDRLATALLSVLIEAHLLDFPSVVAHVGGAPTHPVSAYTVQPAEAWHADLVVQRSRSKVEATLVLSSPDGASSVAYGRSAWASIDELARHHAELVAQQLGVAAQPIPRHTGIDPYAQTLLARSAVALLGWEDDLTETAEKALGIDARLDLARVLLYRNAPSPDRQRLHLLDIADLAHPGDIATRAIARFENHDFSGAWHAWKAYRERGMPDPKFSVVAAASAAAANDESAVMQIVGEMGGPTRLRGGASLIDIGRALARDKVTDRVLADWQLNYPFNLWPVQLRIDQFIESNQLDSALALLPELERRGALGASRQLELALLSESGRYERAAVSAQQLEQRDVAIRLEAAADALASRSVLSATSDRTLRLKRAEDWLEGLQTQRALDEVEAILLEDPWWPEALDLQHRALLTKGKLNEASRVKRRLLHADPLFFEIGL